MSRKTYSFLSGTKEATRVTLVLSKIESITLSLAHEGYSNIYVNDHECPYLMATDKATRVYEDITNYLETE